MNDFSEEEKLWLTIIGSRVLLCTHMTAITDLRARTVALYTVWHYSRHGTNCDFRMEALQE